MLVSILLIQNYTQFLKKQTFYSVSTNYRLNLVESSAREVYVFGLWSREKSGANEKRRRQFCWIFLVFIWIKRKQRQSSKKLLTLNFFCKLKAKINGHALPESVELSVLWQGWERSPWQWGTGPLGTRSLSPTSH